jgi:Tol biopolymer transport system component
MVRARRLLLGGIALAGCAWADDAANLIAVVSGAPHAPRVALVQWPDNVTAQDFPCAPDAAPVWSTDGGTLTFESPADTPGHTAAAWLSVDVQGRATANVVSTRFARNRNPVPSPDGSLIAYEAFDDTPAVSGIAVFDRGTGEEEIWGGERRMLLRPVWLPNAKLLLSIDPSRKIELPGVDVDAVRQESGLQDGSALSKGGLTRALFCIGFDSHEGHLTSELLLVTRTQTLPVLALVPNGPNSPRYSEWSPAVSPGGTRLIFESDYGGDREIYHLDLNGLLNLTNHRAADWNPVWAADGRWLAYESFRDSERAIYRIMVETLRTEKVAANAWHATWSPDGDDIAFATVRDGAPAVVVQDVDSGKQTPLNITPARAPAWRPEP